MADQGAAVERIDGIVQRLHRRASGRGRATRPRPGTRVRVAGARRSSRRAAQPAFPEPETRGLAGDLPLGPTLHGAPGEPPPGADMKKFKMVVPMRPDERKQLPQGASEGEPRKKRG